MGWRWRAQGPKSRYAAIDLVRVDLYDSRAVAKTHGSGGPAFRPTSRVISTGSITPLASFPGLHLERFSNFKISTLPLVFHMQIFHEALFSHSMSTWQLR
jgi:hypothetical protein